VRTRTAAALAATLLAIGIRVATGAPTPTASAACAPVFYNPVGAPKRARSAPLGPGLILMGGGRDVDAAFAWMHDTIAGSPTRRFGDVVVLRASGDNDYDSYIYGLARFDSVRTLLIPNCSRPETVLAAAKVIGRADALFFAGGNQANYVIWKGTPIGDAVRALYARGGVVGGTSAGEAILGQYVFDAVAEGEKDTTSRNALADPYERLMSFTADFLAFPPLRNVITDQHFATRSRFGRLAVFMARQIADGKTPGPLVHGVGVDEGSAVVVDKRGIGTLRLQRKNGSAYMLTEGPARRLGRGAPFASGAIRVTRLARDGETFDFVRWCGREPSYTVSFDGRRVPAASPPDPYAPPPERRVPGCRSSSAH
jgi:cyanophycinase